MYLPFIAEVGLKIGEQFPQPLKTQQPKDELFINFLARKRLFVGLKNTLNQCWSILILNLANPHTDFLICFLHSFRHATKILNIYSQEILFKKIDETLLELNSTERWTPITEGVGDSFDFGGEHASEFKLTNNKLFDGAGFG